MADLQIRLYNHENPPSRKSHYALRISERKWAAMGPVIRRMFARGLTQTEMLRSLDVDHDFRPSRGQLVARICEWKLKRYRPRSTADHSLSDRREPSSRFSRQHTVYVDTLKEYLRIDFVFKDGVNQVGIVGWRVTQAAMAFFLNLRVEVTFPPWLHDTALRLRGRRGFPWLQTFGVPPGNGGLLCDLNVNHFDHTALQQLLEHCIINIKTKSTVSKEQVDDLKQNLFSNLQKCVSQLELQDQYDISQFYVIMCLAAHSINDGDAYFLDIHRTAAHAMLQGILDLWGPGSHSVFYPCIESLKALDLIDLSQDLPPMWLPSIFWRDVWHATIYDT